MSFFGKMFASIGIGSAKVDTVLANDKLTPGEEIKGKVVVKGGNVQQEIDEIYLSVVTFYEREVNDKKVKEETVIGKYRLSERFSINQNETQEIPFSFMLPIDTPVTLGKTKVWVQTGLDIKMAIDPADRDYIEVNAHPLMNAFLNTVTDLGFRLREVEVQAAPRHIRGRLPFLQEFEFVPISGEFRGRLDELEVVFISIRPDQMDVLLQVDRRANNLGGLFSEMLNMDETNLKISVSKEDIPYLKQKLENLIRQYS
ncbi:sporulation protein [Bacillus sp. Marseille-P3661]|uniref:sporulation protein n=1 Tax=Bacillus sp. Marseille-P3661 TaxID=1936234 RepID=UPI000C8182D6|nr:sporulation protein [Bacillus sp. Marseille-P3661]